MNENEEIKRLKAENEKLKNRVDELVAGIKEIDNARVILCEHGAYSIDFSVYGDQMSTVIWGETEGKLYEAIDKSIDDLFGNREYIIDAIKNHKLLQMCARYQRDEASGGYTIILDWNKHDTVRHCYVVRR